MRLPSECNNLQMSGNLKYNHKEKSIFELTVKKRRIPQKTYTMYTVLYRPLLTYFKLEYNPYNERTHLHKHNHCLLTSDPGPFSESSRRAHRSFISQGLAEYYPAQKVELSSAPLKKQKTKHCLAYSRRGFCYWWFIKREKNPHSNTMLIQYNMSGYRRPVFGPA